MKINILIIFLSFNLVLNLHGSEGGGGSAIRKQVDFRGHRPKLAQDPSYLRAGRPEEEIKGVIGSNTKLGRLFGIEVAEKIDLLLSAKNLSMLNDIVRDVIIKHGPLIRLPLHKKAVLEDEDRVTQEARKKFPYQLLNRNTLICTACRESGKSFSNKTQAMLNHPCGKALMLNEIAKNDKYAAVVMRSLLSDMKQSQEQEKSKDRVFAGSEDFDMFAFRVRFSCAAKGERFVSNTMPAKSFRCPSAIIDVGVPGVGKSVKSPGRGTRQAKAGSAI